MRFDGLQLGNFKQKRRIQRTVKHPKYSRYNQAYDFCILTLQNPPITKTNNLTFIEIADCTPLTGYTARIAGWGYTKQFDDNDEMRKLKVLDMKILASRQCKMRFNSSDDSLLYSSSISNESQICATSASGSACRVRHKFKIIILS